jgi:hypothetical protein
MAKRVSLSERLQQDQKKGLDAFFEPPAAKPRAKKATTAPPVKKAAKKTVKQQQPRAEQGELVGVYFHIWNRQDGLLDRIKATLKEREGRRADRSELVREALDLLAKHYNVPSKIEA